ncbi:beta-Ala-His dipeptidase [Psittacicella hinzii]|uniref:Cytosol non-specific dipeptidase n=1 Tax=Psittacicella hinzii TaxID=2028575 RepID=A0A3A1YG25_9GAMM|nr:beta-Ala-His dipeptidase [Psittacicella hinzii]RIY36040.1 hypothetical protein CKF58_06265 [Psittacicella hinzii]
MTTNNILDLNPKLLWKWFNTICSIPHPSYHDQALVNYIVNWAQQQNLDVSTDKAGNVLIRKAASPGYENVPCLALQAHSDMVPQANSDKQHDFLVDPIVPVINGDFLYADNTTLGADNGIGLASALAVLEDPNLKHGPIEVLVTRTEEVGMEGAINLANDWLTAEYMINTDTEEWGELYLGCAGGSDLTFTKELNFKPLKENAKVVKLSLTGFRGGHSGCDIHTNRENAIKCLSKLLYAMYREVKFNFIDLYAGQARNAIPREAYATVMVTEQNYQRFLEAYQANTAKLLSIYGLAEPDGKFILEEQAADNQRRLSCSDMPNLLRFLVLVPNGILRQSDEFANTVESSLSGGILRLNPTDGFKYKILARSTVDTANALFGNEMYALADLTCLTLTISGTYSGWRPETSDFTKFVEKVYNQHNQQQVAVKVIHAGLECGIIKGHYPNMQLVSIGPDIFNPHTPKEHCRISSVEKYYNLIVDLIQNFKELDK